MRESYGKKEKEKRKAKNKEEKAQKMKDRKANNTKGKSLEDMMAYIDENGNITSTPPDTTMRTEIKLEDILLGPAPQPPEDPVKTGVVSYYNDEKGYGFITEDATRENIFMHNTNVLQPVKERDRVSYKKEKSPRGFIAIQVSKIS